MLGFMSLTLTLFNKRSVTIAIKLLSRDPVNIKDSSLALVKSCQVVGLLFFQDILRKVLMCVYTRTEDANELGNYRHPTGFGFFSLSSW